MLIRGLLTLVAISIVAAQDPTFSVDANVVLLYASVRDPNGKLIKDLAQGDFILQEDGKAVAIRYFSREFSAPASIGLLIDTCMQPLLFAREKSSAFAFLDHVLGPSDKAFVMDIGRGVYVLQDFTNSREKLQFAIAGLDQRPRRRSRQTCDAIPGIQRGSQMLKPETGRRAMILLSSGMSPQKQISVSTAIEFAQRSEAMIYSIPSEFHVPLLAYGGSWWVKRGLETLRRLSHDTGGGYFPIAKDQSIEKIFSMIDEELHSQYVIGFVPDPANGSPAYRKLTLTTKSRDQIVHTREGYYPK